MIKFDYKGRRAAVALAVLALAAPAAVADEADKVKACIAEHGQAEAPACALLFGPMPANGNAILFIGLGYARESKGDMDGAMAAYDRAIKVDPANPSGWDSKAQLYFNKLKQPEKAIEVYDSGIATLAEADTRKWLEDRLAGIKQKMSE